MESLINPNVAYLLVVITIMLILLAYINPKSTMMKVWMVLCLGAAGVELVYLKLNPWAFLVVALSPLPFFLAANQTPVHRSLPLLTIPMLFIGSFLLFADQNGRPVVNYGLAGLISLFGGRIIWYVIGRMRNTEGARLRYDPDSVIGLIGETRTDIEVHSIGSVLVDGELWQARSKNPIRAGSTVRILRQDGSVLTVKKVEKLTKE